MLHANSIIFASVMEIWRIGDEYDDESFIGTRSHVADVYELAALRTGVWKEF